MMNLIIVKVLMVKVVKVQIVLFIPIPLKERMISIIFKKIL